MLPSGLFGANAAWSALMCLALNLNTAMKRLVLGAGWSTRRMKAVLEAGSLARGGGLGRVVDRGQPVELPSHAHLR